MSNDLKDTRSFMVAIARLVLVNTLKDISESRLMLAYDEKTSLIKVNIYKELVYTFKDSLSKLEDFEVVVNWRPDNNYVYHPHVSLRFFETYKIN